MSQSDLCFSIREWLYIMQYNIRLNHHRTTLKGSHMVVSGGTCGVFAFDDRKAVIGTLVSYWCSCLLKQVVEDFVLLFYIKTRVSFH